MTMVCPKKNNKQTVTILYEDNHLLIVNKPTGMLVQPDFTKRESVEEWGKRLLKEQKKKKGTPFLVPLHRIDRIVSGIVVLAKTSKALSRLQQSIRQQQWEKEYLALVEPPPSLTEQSLTHFLLRHPFHAAIGSASDKKAKEARLSYKMLERNDPFALLSIRLLTGRYHQIRCQLSAIGSPIVGDNKYGSRFSITDTILLHHHRLSFPHPTRNEIQTIQSFPFPLPDNQESQLLQLWKKKNCKLVPGTQLS